MEHDPITNKHVNVSYVNLVRYNLSYSATQLFVNSTKELGFAIFYGCVNNVVFYFMKFRNSHEMTFIP